METLRRGSEGPAVRRWQTFLRGLELLDSIDGVFGPRTEAATKVFQRQHRQVADGMVGPQTVAAALRAGLNLDLRDPLGGECGSDWPPKPDLPPLISNLEREQVFGKFDYVRIAPGKDDIRILGHWEEQNIVTITVPQLIGVKDAPSSGRIRVHRLVAQQVRALFEAWDRDGLRPLIRTWEGSFVPRFIRGSATTLSNHAWGTAFDVNYAWNQLGHVPALKGDVGSVRELVPRANQLGFYWGGHFSRSDGMHFEVARVLR
jgi:hypothetical protein